MASRLLLVFGVALVLVLPSIVPFALQPSYGITPWRAVSFHNYTDSVAGHTVGRGTITCPGGVPNSGTGEIFSFSANETGASVTGNWYMVVQGAAAADGGSITGGTITATGFNVTGTWTSPGPSYGHTIICSGAPIPATVSIAGNCGMNVTVTLTSSNGVTGTFPGDANCSGTLQLQVQTRDLSNNPISGYYTVLKQGSSVVATAFSPANFAVVGGQTYTVEVQDYGSYQFDHWADTGSTNRDRTLTITSDTLLIAVYRTAASSSSSVTIRSVDQTNTPIYGYYALLYTAGGSLVATGFTTATFSTIAGQGYTVQVADYGTCAFNHWQDTGSTARGKDFVATSSAQTFTAVYNCGTTSSAIFVSTTNSGGSSITGYYITLWQSGVQLQSCFSPCSFSVSSGQTYQVMAASYGSETFNHWQGSGSTGFETVNVPSSPTTISLVAVYSP